MAVAATRTRQKRPTKPPSRSILCQARPRCWPKPDEPRTTKNPPSTLLHPKHRHQHPNHWFKKWTSTVKVGFKTCPLVHCSLFFLKDQPTCATKGQFFFCCSFFFFNVFCPCVLGTDRLVILIQFWSSFFLVLLFLFGQWSRRRKTKKRKRKWWRKVFWIPPRTLICTSDF